MYRRRNHRLEVFLVHPGGPFWKNKDDGAWSIPKGEYSQAEDPMEAAKREFREETGFEPGDQLLELAEICQPSGKRLSAWAFEGDCDPSLLRSNNFSVEWPRRSGQMQEFPEVDRADWFTIDAARVKILKGQLGFLDRLLQKLAHMKK